MLVFVISMETSQVLVLSSSTKGHLDLSGGCLTEAINTQKKLSKRLSQLTALRYFSQLLEVLEYLKSKNILHEDLKGSRSNSLVCLPSQVK